MNILVIAGLFLSSVAFAQKTPDIESLTKRIEQLESQQEELLLNQSESGNQVKAFLKDNLTLGGFLESGVTGWDGEDTRLQIVNQSNILGLNFAADFNNQFRFVSQFLTGLTNPTLNIHNDPRTTPNDREFGDLFFGAVLTQGYLQYSNWSDFRIQAGMGYVPFGYYPQQRELVLFVRRGGPQLLRTNDLFSPLWAGIHISGNTTVATSGYNLYTMNPLDRTNVLGVGGRVWTRSQDERIGAGLSSQVVKFEGHTSEILGADMRIDTSRMVVNMEYAIHMAEENDPWTAYIEPAFKLKNEEFLIYTFADYAQNARNQTSAVLQDPHTKWEYGGGMNWLPTSFTRLRAGLTFHDYLESDNLLGKERDYVSLDLSVGVAF